MKKIVIWRGFVPYDEYIQSDSWKAQRAKAFDRDGHACVICGSRQRLEGHHIGYDFLGTDMDWTEVITVCHDCHMKIENQKKNVRLMKGDQAMSYDNQIELSRNETRRARKSTAHRKMEGIRLSIEISAHIGEFLRNARINEGIMTKDFAASIDVCPSSYSNIEGGRNRITTVELKRAADALKIPVQDIYPDYYRVAACANLRQQRKEHGISVAMLADAAGVTAKDIELIERGDVLMTDEQVGAFANIIGIPSEWIMQIIPAQQSEIKEEPADDNAAEPSEPVAEKDQTDELKEKIIELIKSDAVKTDTIRIMNSTHVEHEVALAKACDELKREIDKQKELFRRQGIMLLSLNERLEAKEIEIEHLKRLLDFAREHKEYDVG